MKYAILKSGSLVNVVVAGEDWQPPAGCRKEAFDASNPVHNPVQVETQRHVSKTRFHTQLHTDAQQLRLEAMRDAAALLDDEELVETDAAATTDEGINVLDLQVLRLMARLEQYVDHIDLLNDATTGRFFAAAKSLGIYGPDSDIADAEIARIKEDRAP